MYNNYEREPDVIEPEVIPDTDTPEKETPADDPYDVPRSHPDASPEPKA